MGSCGSSNKDLSDFDRNNRNVIYHLNELKKLLGTTSDNPDYKEILKRIPTLKQKVNVEIDSLQIVYDREKINGNLPVEEQKNKLEEINNAKRLLNDLEPKYKEVIKEGDNINEGHHNLFY